jgi:hypothetical protein
MDSIQAVTVRIKGWILALALAGIGSVALIIYLRHLWRIHGHGVAWGDVPTWLTFVVVFVGLPAALIQLNMQRIQLRDQQRELQQRQLLSERQQANSVTLTREPSDIVPASFSTAGRVWMAVVANESDRPIRDVACRIQSAVGGRLTGEARIGELVSMATVQGGRTFKDLPPEQQQVSLIRISRAYGFVFSVSADGHPTAQVLARFTDDIGFHWELDQDLHLKKLNHRNDW